MAAVKAYERVVQIRGHDFVVWWSSVRRKSVNLGGTPSEFVDF